MTTTTTTTTTTLPTLAGSEKQVSWANQIRDRKSVELDAFFAAAAAAPAKPGATDEEVAAGRKLLRRIQRSIQNQPKASYWIDRRDRPVTALVAEMATIISKADAAKTAAQ